MMQVPLQQLPFRETDDRFSPENPSEIRIDEAMVAHFCLRRSTQLSLDLSLSMLRVAFWIQVFFGFDVFFLCRGLRLCLDDDSVDPVLIRLLRRDGHDVQVPADVGVLEAATKSSKSLCTILGWQASRRAEALSGWDRPLALPSSEARVLGGRSSCEPRGPLTARTEPRRP